MTQAMYLALMFGLPPALNVLLLGLVYKFSRVVSVAYAFIYIFAYPPDIDYDDKWRVRSKKSMRLFLHFCSYIGMHALFWWACGGSWASHISAVIADFIWFKIVVHRCCDYCFATIVEFESKK